MDWRKIEQALITIAKANKIEITEYKGTSFIQCRSIDSNDEAVVLEEIAVEDLAKGLAERLA